MKQKCFCKHIRRIISGGSWVFSSAGSIFFALGSVIWTADKINTGGELVFINPNLHFWYTILFFICFAILLLKMSYALGRDFERMN